MTCCCQLPASAKGLLPAANYLPRVPATWKPPAEDTLQLPAPTDGALCSHRPHPPLPASEFLQPASPPPIPDCTTCHLPLRHSSTTAACLLPPATFCCLPPATCCLSLVPCRLLLATCLLTLAACCLPPLLAYGPCWLLLATCHLPLSAACCLPLATFPLALPPATTACHLPVFACPLMAADSCHLLPCLCHLLLGPCQVPLATAICKFFLVAGRMRRSDLFISFIILC